MADVPRFFNQPGAAFVLIRDGEKFPPIGTEWQKKPHTFAEAVGHKGNVGILAGNGYIGLDQDEPEAFRGLDLPATTTWETRPGRLGMWFKCDDCTPVAKYGKKADHAQLKLYKDGRSIGEVKLQRTYQVIPNSWKKLESGERVNYKMINSRLPATISLEKLLAGLQAIGITFSSKLESRSSPKLALKRYVESEESKNRRYAEAGLKKEASIMAGSSEGTRNAQLNRSAFAMGQFIAAGVLSTDEVVSELSKAALLTGLDPEEIQKTIESGLEAGGKHPREIPDISHAENVDPKVNDVDPKVKKAAAMIMERGDVLKFLVRQAQKNHIGDTDVIKHLFASIACTNSLTSAGIQPELNGEKGHGKTDAVKAAFHLVPARWKLAASISSKALYYHKDLPTGAIIFSDDVEWSPELIATVKRSMGSFQDPQVHYTLDKNREPLPHTMPARLVWWLSSVESVADDQLKDRQYSLDIDEGGDHTREVSDYLKRSRSEKRIRFSMNKGVEIAREIIREIKEHEPFSVIIPYAKVSDWKIPGDHRTQNKFWDLVEAFAILRFKQRTIEDDGWLRATVEDFNEAKTIFMKRRANHRTHLTNAQAEVVKAVCRLQDNESGATQATIAKRLRKGQPAISKSIKAIMENTNYIISKPGSYGEAFFSSTVSELEVSCVEGDIVSLPKDYQDSVCL